MTTKLENLVVELNELDRQLLLVDGKIIKPSQCFRYETDPLHYMFNTNCPDILRQKITAIFEKHDPSHTNDEWKSKEQSL